MKNLLEKIGAKSKKAFEYQLDLKKKNKVLKDYCNFIKKNKLLIIKANKRDIKNARNKKIRENLEKELENEMKELNYL